MLVYYLMIAISFSVLCQIPMHHTSYMVNHVVVFANSISNLWWKCSMKKLFANIPALSVPTWVFSIKEVDARSRLRNQ
jgi:hypothetical protein